MAAKRHKFFLSYHTDDAALISDFIEEFDDQREVFITRGIRAREDIIGSTTLTTSCPRSVVSF
jgi:hypothetical protein